MPPTPTPTPSRRVRSLFPLLIVGLVALGLASPRAARADETAPELEGLELRQKARNELRRLMIAATDDERRRLVGLYLAFDPSPSDAIAQVACDDDGDFVIVVSDAMLRLVATVARAQSHDEVDASRRTEELAALLAHSQRPGRRLLPPPAGFYDPATATPATEDDRLREALAFVLARELAHLAAGDLRCPHPTATTEHGDADWTAAERAAARSIAGRVYPGDATARDAGATARVLASGRGEAGALGLLLFFAALEAASPGTTSRWPYLANHPDARARTATVRASAARWQAAQAPARGAAGHAL